jgi:hypothetical protein
LNIGALVFLTCGQPLTVLWTTQVGMWTKGDLATVSRRALKPARILAAHRNVVR